MLKTRIRYKQARRNSRFQKISNFNKNRELKKKFRFKVKGLNNLTSETKLENDINIKINQINFYIKKYIEIILKLLIKIK